MTENQFLQELENALMRLPKEERNDILQDIREYFSNGRNDGKSDKEIAAKLGSPLEIAAELIESFDFNKAETPLKTINPAKDEFDKVDIQIDNGALIISSSADGRMHVDVEDKSYNQQLEVDILNRTLVITLKEEVKKWGIFSFTINTKTPIVTVQLPQKTYEQIKMDTDNGYIKGEKLESMNFKAESDNGRIQLRQVKATVFRAESDNGAIELDSIQAENLSAKTDNGKIELSDIQANSIALETDNGRISMAKIGAETIHAKTDNGRINLLTDSLERSIDLKTDNGSITVESVAPPTDVTIRAAVSHKRISIFGEKNPQAVYGQGSNLVKLKSDNGSITVKQL